LGNVINDELESRQSLEARGIRDVEKAVGLDLVSGLQTLKEGMTSFDKFRITDLRFGREMDMVGEHEFGFERGNLGSAKRTIPFVRTIGSAPNHAISWGSAACRCPAESIGEDGCKLALAINP
jgi:hypothetical protein